jgi:ornithine cyclodeaminase/alanine dehydrogenase-like protein (mu-crystallin family)
MVRIIRDDEVRAELDLPALVAAIEDGYRADARGEIVPFPRSRIEARGTTLAWLGAALPEADLLGFRSYLYGSGGGDRGHQVVALYRHGSMELRALFVGRLVGNLRTGASIAAALHLVDPSTVNVGMIGTGYQARNAAACLAAVFPALRLAAWSPNEAHRSSFATWSRETLGIDVELARTPTEALDHGTATVLVTASESPVIPAEVSTRPRLLISINAYRFPEIPLPLLDEALWVGTDSVAQASAPGTLFEREPRRSKLRPLCQALQDGTFRDPASLRIVVNTGAAWEETIAADRLCHLAVQRGLGTEIDLPPEPSETRAF